MHTEKAYAKVNLFLDITSHREDGFHDIATLMQSVSLCDTLTFDVDLADNIEIILEADTHLVPTDSANLVYRAILAYLFEFGISARVRAKLEKRIPVGAGLAGGSSDAAAALRAMRKIFGRGSDCEILALAEKLGSDVPFCLNGGTAFCTGRGEIITPMHLSTPMNLVISIGDSRISTPQAYSKLDAKYENFSDYSPVPYNVQALDIDTVCSNLYNIFESVTDLAEIEKIKGILTSHGAKGTVMSGSGPSVVGIFADDISASLAADALYSSGFIAYTASTIKP